MREQAYQALLKALTTALEPWPVQRNGTGPQDIAGGPVAILRDGEADLEEEPTLGVRTWPWADPATVELYAQPGAEGDAEALLEELVSRLEAGLADRTLGGTVDFLEVGRPSLVLDDPLGVGQLMAGTVTVTLYYTSAAASG